MQDKTRQKWSFTLLQEIKNTQKLVNPIILLEHPNKEDFDLSKYRGHKYYNTPGNPNSEKYVIKISRVDSGTPEEWIIFN